jgi:hypothetical protein
LAFLPLVSIGEKAHHGGMIPMQMKTEFAEQHVADLRRAARHNARYDAHYDFPMPQPVETPARPRPKPWVFHRRVLVRWGLVMPPAPKSPSCA